MHSNNSFIDEKLFDMHKHVGGGRKSEGSERRGWKVVYEFALLTTSAFNALVCGDSSKEII